MGKIRENWKKGNIGKKGEFGKIVDFEILVDLGLLGDKGKKLCGKIGLGQFYSLFWRKYTLKLFNWQILS
jgi:hypothetical protein